MFYPPPKSSSFVLQDISLHLSENKVLPKLVPLASQSKHGDVRTQLRIISDSSEISQISIFKGLTYLWM